MMRSRYRHGGYLHTFDWYWYNCRIVTCFRQHAQCMPWIKYTVWQNDPTSLQNDDVDGLEKKEREKCRNIRYIVIISSTIVSNRFFDTSNSSIKYKVVTEYLCTLINIKTVAKFDLEINSLSETLTLLVRYCRIYYHPDRST
jgi:hypothetical protein